MEITKEVVSVSEMARMLGLSRARFYQLMKTGVFPKPEQSPETKRPFFDREKQEQCVEVRRTNRGVNGKVILFYTQRPPRPPPQASRTRRRGRPRPAAPGSPASTNDTALTELRHGLTQLGLADVTDRSIRDALVDLYPDGHAEIDSTELLRAVFGRLRCQDSSDNVAR